MRAWLPWVIPWLTLVACSAPPRPSAVAGPEVVCGAPGEAMNVSGIDALSGCTRYRGDIHISDSGFEDLNVLSGLRVVDGSLTFFRNERLTSLRGLEQLERVRVLGFGHHSHLDLSPLKNLQTVDELYFISNGIESLHGLEQLRVLPTGLAVVANSRLLSLDGLAGLERAGKLDIRSNSSLQPGEAERFAAGLTVTGAVTVSENGP